MEISYVYEKSGGTGATNGSGILFIFGTSTLYDSIQPRYT